MKKGLTNQSEIIVEKNMLASSLGSGLVDVFATPYMVAKMEGVCSDLLIELVGEGNVTVGVVVDIKHLSATPEGMKVTFKCEITDFDEKTVTFNVEAFDEVCKIGEGVHVRAIVNEERFMQKVNGKKN